MSQVVGMLRPAMPVKAFGVMTISEEAISRPFPSGENHLPEMKVNGRQLPRSRNSMSFSPPLKCSDSQSHPV